MNELKHYSLNLNLLEGRFLRRPNRFVVYVEIDGKECGASLPNPGKMQELLFPGVTMLLMPMDTDRVTYPFRVEGIITDQNDVIMLNTVKTNDCAAWLVEHNLIPSLNGWRLVRREITVGSSRFDLLLEKEGKELYCEVKSCTLFGGNMAMFPDAVTDRGRRHVEELGELARSGVATAVLFMIHSHRVHGFCPDYHTDPAFSATLYENRFDVQIIPLSLGWDRTLTLTGGIREIPLRWDLYEKHGVLDSGIYLFLMELDEDRTIQIGALGEIDFSKGFYCYVGSAKIGLSKRIDRHKRQRKAMHWHIDYLRTATRVVGSWPVRSALVAECELAQMVGSIAECSVGQFGSSDCRCESHLFYFSSNPTRTRPFQDILTDVRMVRV